jgi:hypothetical protein
MINRSAQAQAGEEPSPTPNKIRPVRLNALETMTRASCSLTANPTIEDC